MLSRRAAFLIAVLLLVSACAISHVMPPFSVTRSYASLTMPPTATALPAHRLFGHHKHITREYDPSTDQTRVSLTTHRGTYFLWIQRPRLTFFSVYAGRSSTQTPASVFLVFQTRDPQLPASNHLTMECDGTPEDLAVTPVFWLEPGPMTSSRHYMYELPLPRLAALGSCGRVAIAVGDVNAPFSEDQLEALRDFASGLQPR